MAQCWHTPSKNRCCQRRCSCAVCLIRQERAESTPSRLARWQQPSWRSPPPTLHLSAAFDNTQQDRIPHPEADEGGGTYTPSWPKNQTDTMKELSLNNETKTQISNWKHAAKTPDVKMCTRTAENLLLRRLLVRLLPNKDANIFIHTQLWQKSFL